MLRNTEIFFHMSTFQNLNPKVLKLDLESQRQTSTDFISFILSDYELKFKKQPTQVFCRKRRF